MMETFENIMSDRRAFSEIPEKSLSAESTPIVDIDLNLLKNLLESHASQIGIEYSFKLFIVFFKFISRLRMFLKIYIN
jgi:hypothetical protein